jgi:hypothetical protein
MKSVKRQLQLLLTTMDQAQLSHFLREQVPGLRFLDDNVWASRPVTRSGIEACSTGRVYLYNQPLDSLPTITRPNGELEGPTAGCVIQLLRPVQREHVLFSGRIAVGHLDTDTAMRDFVQSVWKCVRRVGRIGVLRPDGRVDRNYLVGADAGHKHLDGVLEIRDRATEMLYQPANK